MQADVDIGVICLVEARDVAIHDGERDRAVGNHFNEVLGDEGVFVDSAYSDTTAQFIVEIAEPSIIFRVFYHPHLLAGELSNIGENGVLFPHMLHEHLVRDVLLAAVNHAVAIFGGDGDFVGNHVDKTRIEHLEHGVHGVSHFDVEFHPLVFGEIGD